MVFHSTALALSGAYLLFMAGAGYYVRYFGGAWGGTLQARWCSRRWSRWRWSSSGRFRAQLRVFVSKHFFSYRYDYRDEWLRFTRTLSAHDRPRVAAGNLHPGARPTWSRARPARCGCAQGGRASAQVGAHRMPAVREAEPLDGPLGAFLRGPAG